MSHTFNFKLVLRALGALLIIESFFMFLSTGVAYWYHEYDDSAFLLSSIITLCAGIMGVLIGRKAPKKLGRREGYLTVALVWVVFSFFGLLPFYFSGAIPNYTDAFFETMSGFTTTGSTILTDIESLPHGILFWRCLTQWLGGMGIIVLSLAILPMFGLGGMQLYTAEVTGPTYEKLSPRIKDTAKLLWGIYLLLTAIETALLNLFGMGLFDAVCHSLTTMATGGYSTKNMSIAAFQSPAIEYTITLFMLMGGINFGLLYYLIRGKVSRLWHDEETRWYIFGCLIFTLLIAIGLFVQNHNISLKGAESSFRNALFTVVATITTTGFVTVDYMMWKPVLWVTILFLMISGGSAASTSGGIKWVRIAILFKNGFAEFKRLIHPNAIIPVKLNKKAVTSSTIANVMAFMLFYLAIIIVTTLIFTLLGIDFNESFGAAISAISNIGPGAGASGPSGNFAAFPLIGKWIMAFVMLIGRLELFTILLLFSPALWKK